MHVDAHSASLFPQSRAESWPRRVCDKMAELLKECESARCPPLCAVFRKEKVALDLANPDLCDVLEVDLLVQPEPCEKHVSNGFIQPSLVDQLVFLGLAQYNRDIGTCTSTVNCTQYNLAIRI